MLLEIDSIDSFYGQSHVLHGVSLSVDDNEIVALLGRNGAGKTTTIGSVMGTVPEVEGDIRFRDESITALPPEQVFKRGISWIPERRRVFSTLTVEDNLKMGIINSDNAGRREEAYREVFDLFPRLEERRNQTAGTMSGGEQQMLAIGRALVSDPDLLLVDEPFEGLMPALIPEIADVLRRMQERDISMLIAEQKTETALELADRVFILDSGSIVFSGEADRLIGDEELQEQYLGVRA